MLMVSKRISSCSLSEANHFLFIGASAREYVTYEIAATSTHTHTHTQNDIRSTLMCTQNP